MIVAIIHYKFFSLFFDQVYMLKYVCVKYIFTICSIKSFNKTILHRRSFLDSYVIDLLASFRLSSAYSGSSSLCLRKSSEFISEYFFFQLKEVLRLILFPIDVKNVFASIMLLQKSGYLALSKSSLFQIQVKVRHLCPILNCRIFRETYIWMS